MSKPHAESSSAPLKPEYTPATHREMVAVAAYYRAERRGFAPGYEMEDWCKAEAEIDRVLHLGFEVRVELTLTEGESTWVQTTRERVEELELAEGAIVWLRPADSPVAA